MSMTCYWCESLALERRSSGSELVRLSVCMDCGTEMKATFDVSIKSLLALCKRDKKITAIKLHRVHTKTGLEEAKDFVDELTNYM